MFFNFSKKELILATEIHSIVDHATWKPTNDVQLAWKALVAASVGQAMVSTLTEPRPPHSTTTRVDELPAGQTSVLER